MPRRLCLGLILSALVLWLACAPMTSNRDGNQGSSETNVGPTATRVPPARGTPDSSPTVVPSEGRPSTRATPSPTPEPDPRYAVVLLGYRGFTSQGAYLTDSMIVAIVDPTKKTLTFVSVPRDLWVPLEFSKDTVVYNKLNTAYALAKDPRLYPDRSDRYTGDDGPGNLVMDTLSRILGIPVQYYVAIDFAGFQQMIDAVGGIDVEVKSSFTARYPANDDPSIDPRWTIVRFYEGIEHMDGQRAMQFARAREVIDNPAEANDFGRSRRQIAIIEAFKTRLFQPSGLIRLPQLLSIGAQHVTTNYGLPSPAEVRTLLLDWEDVEFFQVGLTTGNFFEEGTGPQGAYVVIPRAPEQSWAQVRSFFRRLWKDPALGVELANTEILVINRTGVDGIATRVSASLAQLGYRLGTPDGSSTQTGSRIVDRTGGKADLVIAALQRDLGMTIPVVTEDANPWTPQLVLEIGAEDRQLANLRVPVDRDAPSSSVGIAIAGRWSPAPPAEEPSPMKPLAKPPMTTTPEPDASPEPTITPVLLDTETTPEPTEAPTEATEPGEEVIEPALTQSAPTEAQ